MGRLSELRQKSGDMASVAMARGGEMSGSQFRAIGGPGPGGGVGYTDLFGSSKTRGGYANFRNWVHVCISAIARRLSAQSIMAGRYTGEESTKRGGRVSSKAWSADTGWRARVKRGGYPAKNLNLAQREWLAGLCEKFAIGDAGEVDVLPTHPVLQDLESPNHVQRHFEFWFSWVANLYLTGEAYVIAEPDGEEPDGTPKVTYWSVPTHWVIPQHDGALFSGYKIRVNDKATPEDIDAELVARHFFADPSDLKAALSPIVANIQAVEIDQYIQKSQVETYERGVIPNVLITVGNARTRDGKDTGKKPRLKGGQRRQVVNVVRRLWQHGTANGEPGIIDGFIDKIEKLSNSPQEMDWLQSGETAKSRIFQCFGVNPYVVGEVTGINKAQALVAEQAFCDGVVNPLLSSASQMLTAFCPFFYSESGVERDEIERGDLLVWFEKAEPGDEELELKRWESAAKLGFVSGSEFRSGVLGLGERDQIEGVNLNGLARTAQGAAAIAKLVADVQAHTIPVDAAALLATTVYGFDAAQAAELFPEPPEKQEPPPMLPGQQPPGLPAPSEGGDLDGGSDSEPDEETETGGERGVRTVGGFDRQDLKSFFKARAVAQQVEVAATLGLFFRGASGGDIVRAGGHGGPGVERLPGPEVREQ